MSTSVDLPLSHECKRVLAYGAEEAERLNPSTSEPSTCCSACCARRSASPPRFCTNGAAASAIREELARSQSEKVASQRPGKLLLSEFSRDLAQSAMDNTLDPLIGRDYETERVVQILCRRTKIIRC